MATAHVPQHAFGAAYYALKAVAAADPADTGFNIAREWDWQVQHVSENIRDEVIKTVIIQKNGNRITVRIEKGTDF